MGLGSVVLQGLAAAMTIGASQGPDPKPPEDVQPACAEGERRVEKHGKTVCERDPDAVDGITIEGKRGATEGPIKPEVTLNEDAIAALGGSTIAELLVNLEPLTRSNRGRTGNEPPIQLLNGQLTSGPEEIGSIPREAIKKLEILPEEAALAYGFKADQKVVNFTLKPNYVGKTLTYSASRATDGGRAGVSPVASIVKIDPDGRWTGELRYRRDSPLYEDERDIVRAPVVGAAYDLQGNLVSTTSGGEIDPALSALAGTPVTVAAVPGSAAGGRPAIGDFAAGAGRTASDDLTTSRTLRPRMEQGSVKGGYSRKVGHATVSFSGGADSTRTSSDLGLAGGSLTIPTGNPFSPFARDVVLQRYWGGPESLRQTNQTDTVKAAMAATGMVSGLRWTFTGGADRTDNMTRTGRGLDISALQAAVSAGDPTVNPFGPAPGTLVRPVAEDTAHSVFTNAKADLTVMGPILQLPAGRLRGTVKVGADHRQIQSDSVRSGVRTARTLNRDRTTLNSSLDVPLLTREGGTPAFLGEVGLNGNVTYERFSDIGGLVTAGGGVNWSPLKKLTLTANYSSEEGEPTPEQLNNPILQTPNVSMYDYATGQTVLVTRTSGGNPGLSSDSRHVVKLGAGYELHKDPRVAVSANYTASRINDQIATFPAISPELEAAFPGRFTRDATGRLISVDTRPVNYAYEDSRELNWRLDYMQFFMEPIPGAPKGSERSKGYVSFSLEHRWRLRDEVLIHDGMAPLDLLNGASLGQRGGKPRHEVTLQAQGYRVFLGANARVVWRSATRVDGGVLGDGLRFSSLATTNLAFWLRPGDKRDWVKRWPQLKGTQVSLTIDNPLNAKQHVRDAHGRTPQAYQEDYLDPVGRQVGLSVRKLF